MKIITIQPTKGGQGYVANVNGFQGATAIAKDEITALRHLIEKLESKNAGFIQRNDWTWGNGIKEETTIPPDPFGDFLETQGFKVVDVTRPPTNIISE